MRRQKIASAQRKWWPPLGGLKCRGRCGTHPTGKYRSARSSRRERPSTKNVPGVRATMRKSPPPSRENAGPSKAREDDGGILQPNASTKYLLALLKYHTGTWSGLLILV